METLIVQNILAGPRAGMKLAGEERIGDDAWWKRERDPLVVTGKRGGTGTASAPRIAEPCKGDPRRGSKP